MSKPVDYHWERTANMEEMAERLYYEQPLDRATILAALKEAYARGATHPTQHPLHSNQPIPGQRETAS